MTFDDAVLYIMKYEGGLSNDPNDAGGTTKYGISKKAFPDIDIKNLSLNKAKQLYREHYWDKLKLDAFPKTVRLLVFDAAVNQGPNWTIKEIQKFLGEKQDGIIGPKTLAAVKKMSVPDFMHTFACERIKRYGENPAFGYFGKGWMLRLFDAIFSSSNIWHG